MLYAEAADHTLNLNSTTFRHGPTSWPCRHRHRRACDSASRLRVRGPQVTPGRRRPQHTLRAHGSPGEDRCPCSRPDPAPTAWSRAPLQQCARPLTRPPVHSGHVGTATELRVLRPRSRGIRPRRLYLQLRVHLVRRMRAQAPQHDVPQLLRHLTPRPIRPASTLADHPPSNTRVIAPDCVGRTASAITR